MNKILTNYWTSKYNSFIKLKKINLNFGPQHPAAHGVLRMLLQLKGEIILKSDPHIGFLHRGTEKLIEKKTYIKALPYFDRLDYISTLSQEHAFCLSIENLLKLINKNTILQITRTIFDELTRILNHLLALACHALDVGSMSSIFWAFEEREKIMSFYEEISGARMHTAYYRPGHLYRQINNSLKYNIYNFLLNFNIFLNEMTNILNQNNIWRLRLKNIGTITIKDSLNWGLSGIISRSTGLKNDLRINTKYSYGIYKYIIFNSFFSTNGDSLDRYNLRILELMESIKIINNSLKFIDYNKNKNKLLQINKNKYSMESTINHFKFWTEGFFKPKGLGYSALESPKGEFGVYIITNGNGKPLRCKIRSPSYHHLQLLKKLSSGLLLADLVTLIGTIDIVFGEIDR